MDYSPAEVTSVWYSRAHLSCLFDIRFDSSKCHYDPSSRRHMHHQHLVIYNDAIAFYGVHCSRPNDSTMMSHGFHLAELHHIVNKLLGIG